MATFIARRADNGLIVCNDDTDKKTLLQLAAAGLTIYAVRPQGNGNFLLVRQKAVNVEYKQTVIAADFEDEDLA